MWAGERGLVRMPTFSPLPVTKTSKLSKAKEVKVRKPFFFPFSSLDQSFHTMAAEAPPKPPDARPPPPQTPPKRPLRRLKVIVRGMPAGVDAELARERIAGAAGGASMVQWLRVWRASERCDSRF